MSEEMKVCRVILQKNKSSDAAMCQLLKGFLHRPEFHSLTSQLNEIGPESADVICRLIDSRYGEPGYPPEPIIDEETLAALAAAAAKQKKKPESPKKTVSKVLKPAYTRPYPKFEYLENIPPELTELKLIANKSDPVSFDRIIAAVRFSRSLVKLSLQKMNLSERHSQVLFKWLKNVNL